MGKFNFIKTSIDGVVIIEPTAYGDSRGYFMETYQKEDFKAGGIDIDFVQTPTVAAHPPIYATIRQDFLSRKISTESSSHIKF